MLEIAEERFDPFEVTADAQTDEVRQLRQAENVLSSYSRALDFLAEALQNATDAIDTRAALEAAAPARIQIDFDVSARQFSVTDTGTGISRNDLRVILAPNVTLKAGRLARTGTSRSRGHKGVGLTFLALASNRLHIRTSDGENAWEVMMEGANDWVVSQGKSPKPSARLRRIAGDPAQRLDSDKYTVISVGGLDPELFDRDLFSIKRPELVWLLRTQTAVGNTAHLFKGPPEPDIDVELRYSDKSGSPTVDKVPYRYATPEELIPADLVLAFEDVDDLPAADIHEVTRGRAVRYKQTFAVPSERERPVWLYTLVIDGREMQQHRDAANASGNYFPPEWQGFWVATRDMPTGIRFHPEVINPRTLERRVFALIQEDELVLDLGRKSFVGKSGRMLKDIVERAWNGGLSKLIWRVGEGEAPDRTSLGPLVTAARGQADLDLPIPYLKQPRRAAAVMAVFHELLAKGGNLPKFRGLTNSVFGPYDALMYIGEPNGVQPMHVLFAADANEIVGGMEQDARSVRTADLAVVWALNERGLRRRHIETVPLESSPDGATHELMLHGIADRESLRVIVLSELVGNAVDVG